MLGWLLTPSLFSASLKGVHTLQLARATLDFPEGHAGGCWGALPSAANPGEGTTKESMADSKDTVESLRPGGFHTVLWGALALGAAHSITAWREEWFSWDQEPVTLTLPIRDCFLSSTYWASTYKFIWKKGPTLIFKITWAPLVLLWSSISKARNKASRGGIFLQVGLLLSSQSSVLLAILKVTRTCNKQALGLARHWSCTKPPPLVRPWQYRLGSRTISLHYCLFICHGRLPPGKIRSSRLCLPVRFLGVLQLCHFPWGRSSSTSVWRPAAPPLLATACPAQPAVSCSGCLTLLADEPGNDPVIWY